MGQLPEAFIAAFIWRTPRVRPEEAPGHKLLAMTCVGSSALALCVIISSCNTTETAPGWVFLLLNQISIIFIVLLLHKSEKGRFVVQPGFFFFSSLQASKRFSASHSSKQVVYGSQKAHSFPSAKQTKIIIVQVCQEATRCNI